MKNQCDWVSSFDYGGELSVAATNRNDMAPSHDCVNVESILSELRSVGEVEHTFRLVQIGRAMLRRPPPSLANLQLVLRDFYFNFRRYASPAMSAEHLVTVSSRGLLFTSRDPSGEIEKINSVRFGPDSIVQATAVRFATKQEKSKLQKAHHQQSVQPSLPKKPKIIRAQEALLAAVLSLAGRHRSQPNALSGRFCVIDKHKFSAAIYSIIAEQQGSLANNSSKSHANFLETSVNNNNAMPSPTGEAATLQQGAQPPWFLIQPEYAFLSHVYHPPIVAFILRRQHRVRSIDLHVFVCCSDSDAVQLVTFVTALCENANRLSMVPNNELPPSSSDTLTQQHVGLKPPNYIQTNNKVNQHPNVNNHAAIRATQTGMININSNVIRTTGADSSTVDDGSYYERLIVKEQTAAVATAVVNSSTLTKVNGFITLNSTLTRRNTESKLQIGLPFVNPNVALSPFGTIESSQQQQQAAIRSRSISKLATPFLAASERGIINNKPATIFDVVDKTGSVPNINVNINAAAARAKVGAAKSQGTVANVMMTVQASPVRVVPSSESEDDKRDVSVISSSSSKSVGTDGDYSNGNNNNNNNNNVKIRDDDIVRATLDLTPQPRTLTGELRPVPEVIKPKNRHHLKLIDDDNWSRSEFPKSLQQTSPKSEMMNQKAISKFGDVQTLLGYLP